MLKFACTATALVLASAVANAGPQAAPVTKSISQWSDAGLMAASPQAANRKGSKRAGGKNAKGKGGKYVGGRKK